MFPADPLENSFLVRGGFSPLSVLIGRNKLLRDELPEGPIFGAWGGEGVYETHTALRITPKFEGSTPLVSLFNINLHSDYTT